MGQGQQAAKLHSNFRYQDLAKQMSELRTLRELVRNVETKWRLGRSTTQIAVQCSLKDEGKRIEI